jgi:hypothetical protein
VRLAKRLVEYGKVRRAKGRGKERYRARERERKKEKKVSNKRNRGG